MRSHYAVENMKKTVLLLLIAAVLGLFGCSAVGTLVPESERIVLADMKSDSGTFKQGLLTIEYSSSISGDKLSLAGKVGYLGGVDSLDVRVVFLDEQGVVLEQKLVYSVAYRASSNLHKGWNFEKVFVLPAKSAGFSFNYSAQDRRNRR